MVEEVNGLGMNKLGLDRIKKEEKKNKFFALLGECIIAICVGLICDAYKAFVLLKVVAWYNLPLNFTFKQMFGVLFFLGILMVKFPKGDEESWWKKIINQAVIITILLGILYLVKFFI